MKNIIVFILGMVLSFIAITYALRTKPVEHVEPLPTLDTNRIESLVNEHRETLGLSTLQESPLTCTTARVRSKEIQEEFSHRKFNDHARFYTLGENLATGYIHEEELVDAWLNSRTHKEIMELPEYNYGCVRCQGLACVHMFSVTQSGK